MSLERERDEREEEKQQKRRSSEKGRGGRRKSGEGRLLCCGEAIERPVDDFTTSMVEMIVEKQIFGARDLEVLLETFSVCEFSSPS
ncbi:hypothetical protein RHMOL_Rhmol04G0176100 [Rhododendron molle]|uniref:Uncharacterized protein n=1 Tax=Rhododendron molle TaxID=49168 RepID=A0ACC0P3R8_RHOML|nr:hypothetical protein RHMOL_Rhmol04G0176100 [Rhododendron molle]